MLKQTGLAIIVATVLSTFGAVSANAIVYTYTGDLFDTVNAPYTTAESVTGSVTLASALANNLSLATITPLSFSFSDGIQTLTEASGTSQNFIFSTNATGIITGWFIQVATGYYGIYSYYPSAIPSPGHLFDQAAFFGGYGQTSGPGFWSDSLTATPLPATLPLFASGLGVLGLLGWRRKRKQAA